MKFHFLATFLTVPLLCLGEGNPVDQLTPRHVSEAIEKIRSGGKLDDNELERARLQGLLTRQGEQARLVSTKAPDAAAKEAFRSELLPRSILYLRLGDLTGENVHNLTAALTKPSAPAGIILDLRATRQGDSYELAARVINLFCPKGTPYFQMSGGQDAGEKFSGTTNPLFSGMIVILVNRDSSGPAETIAAALRQRVRALLAGTVTAGRALKYDTFPMDGNLALQVAVARVVLTDGGADFSKGLQPDLAVAVDLEMERQILAAAAREGVAKYIFEVERPHMNEASLVSGRNPEIDVYQARQARGNTPDDQPPLDRTLQRALDTLTTVLIYRAPKAVENQ